MFFSGHAVLSWKMQIMSYNPDITLLTSVTKGLDYVQPPKTVHTVHGS